VKEQYELKLLKRINRKESKPYIFIFKTTVKKTLCTTRDIIL